METMSRSPKAKTRIQFSKNFFFFGHFSFVGTATKSILWLSLVTKSIQASGLSLCSTNHRLTIWVIMGHIKRPTREWQGKPVDQQDSVSLTHFGLITPCAVSTSNSELFIQPDHVQTISILSNFITRIKVSLGIRKYVNVFSFTFCIATSALKHDRYTWSNSTPG